MRSRVERASLLQNNTLAIINETAASASSLQKAHTTMATVRFNTSNSPFSKVKIVLLIGMCEVVLDGRVSKPQEKLFILYLCILIFRFKKQFGYEVSWTSGE